MARKGRVELVCNLQEEGQSDPLSLSLLTADLAHATFSSFRSDDYDGRINRSSEVFTRTVTASTAAMSIKRDLPFTDKNDVGLSEKEEWQSTSDPRRFFDLRR